MRKRARIPASDIAWLALAVGLFFAAHGVVWVMDEAEAKAAPPAKEVVVAEPFLSIPKFVEAEPCPLEVSTFYDVPLDIELQAHIINKCGAYEIEPAIVFAMIERESTFQSDVVGDSGKSFGLMQVQKRWHEERMERLGVTDLLNPYQNVTVGIDYLAELMNRGNGVDWALAAYNAGATGANKGYGESYAIDVLERSETIKEMTINVLY